MANIKDKVTYEFRELANVPGGRFHTRVKIGKGSDGREFVALQVGAKFDDRELVQLRKQVESKGSVYANFNVSITDLKADIDALQRVLKLAESIEAKIDSKLLDSI